VDFILIVKKIPYQKLNINYKMNQNRQMLINYRELKIVDAEKIRKWRNNQIKILRQNEKIKKKDQVKYFKEYILLKSSKLDLFAIDLNQKLVGYAGLVNISNYYNTAEVSFLINDKFRHNTELYKKIFTHFLFFIKEYSFKKKKLRRLYTETFSFRKKHIRLLENSGFKLEGTMKKHVIKNKKTYDSLIHGILKN
jgi:RimJ/RimL family protein N-acetyltransferase